MDCYPIVLLILRSSNVMGTSALWEEMLKKTHRELGHLLIYLLLCSNHLHALHCLFCSYAITFWAAAPKGMKSCRTQDFYQSIPLFVCPSNSPPQALSGLKSVLSCLKYALLVLKSALSALKSAPSGLKSALSGLKSALSGLESEFRA